jgi:hypothetical protein
MSPQVLEGVSVRATTQLTNRSDFRPDVPDLELTNRDALG